MRPFLAAKAVSTFAKMGGVGGVRSLTVIAKVDIYCLDALHFKLKSAKDKAEVNFSIKWRSMPLEDTLR